jgi:hypothetical protein
MMGVNALILEEWQFFGLLIDLSHLGINDSVGEFPKAFIHESRDRMVKPIVIRGLTLLHYA